VRKVDVAGLVVLILAGAIAVSMVISFTALAIHAEHISPDSVPLLDTVAGAIIGVIATYVGMRSQRRD
jgi:hypothetical protein